MLHKPHLVIWPVQSLSTHDSFCSFSCKHIHGHFLPVLWPSRWHKSTSLETLLNNTSIQLLNFAIPCKHTSSASASAFSSLSMILSMVTIRVGSFLTVFNVRSSPNFICFPMNFDSSLTSSKYSFNIIVSAGAWLGSLWSSNNKSSLEFSRSVRLCLRNNEVCFLHRGTIKI